MLTIHLFGYPSVFVEKKPVTGFISQKALVLFCYLSLEPQVHARERLAGLFWAEMPQERAMSNLRQALHNLQKLLPDALIVTRQTVQLHPEMPVIRDTEHLMQEKIGDHPTHYVQPFLAGITIEDAEELQMWISQRTQQYALQTSHVLTQLLDNAWDTDDLIRALHIATLLATHDLYQEQSQVRLWRVMLWQGDLIGILNRYTAFAQQLQDELGVDASLETQTFIQRLKTAHAVERHNLPTPHNVFVGREAEVLQMMQQLRQSGCRLLTVTGIGGVGKSRLAQELARRVASWFVNGVRLIQLGNLNSSLYIASTLADTLGISIPNVSHPFEEITRLLAEQELLLVFDQAEHLPETGELIAQILAAAPSVKILVTSRERLNLREEWVLTLEGLPTVDEQSPGVALLHHTARQIGAALPNHADALALCQQMEGLPLGLEMAAGMLSNHTAADIRQAVRVNMDALRAPWSNMDVRQRTLRSVFQTSWEQLLPTEQNALTRLAFFTGSFDGSAARQIADADDEMLTNLQRKSLVIAASDRCRLHSVVRHYAAEYPVTDDALLKRLNAFYSQRLESAEALFRTRQIPQAVQLIRIDLDGIRQMWEISVHTRDLALIARMIPTLHRFYEGIGWFSEGISQLREACNRLALDVTVPQERQLHGRLLSHMAGLLLRAGDVPTAHQIAEESVGLLSQSEESPELLAFALNALGIAQLYTGKPEEARTTFESCASLYRLLQLPDLLKPLVNLGALYTRTGDHARAVAVLEEAHPLANAIGDQMGTYHITNSLGVVYGLQEQYARAIACYEQALTLCESVGFLQGKAFTLNNLGDTWYLIGQAQKGVTFAQQAVALAQQINDKRSLCHALNTLTLNQTALNMPTARQTLDAALTAALESGSEPLMLMVLYTMGEWLYPQNPARAVSLWNIVAHHPATEMDYRRRAVSCLPADVTTPEMPNPLSELMERMLSDITSG